MSSGERKGAERGVQFGKSTQDISEGASSNDDSSGCHSRSYEAV
jgi:hypothetical protein